MFMAFMSLVIVCSGPLLGGQIQRLAGLRFRYGWLILLALATQVLITEVLVSAPRVVLVALHLASYIAAGVALWANRALPGLLLIGAGTLLNAGVIALNGGTLPASARALAAAGLPVVTPDFANSGTLAHPHLSWLGDILATPAWLPFRNVISIGDLVILVGAVVLVHAVMGSWPARQLRRVLGRRRPDELCPREDVNSESPRPEASSPIHSAGV
jgi:hypothetical protein